MSPEELCYTVWGGEVLFLLLPYATECLVGLEDAGPVP